MKGTAETIQEILSVNIALVKPNPKNPRIIKDEKYAKLVKSIQEFPEMLKKRPLVCFTDTDSQYVVLGGNMRLKAATQAGLKNIPIMLADDWTEEQKQEFLIKDNVGYGEWDWDELANNWDTEKLTDWGLDIPDFAAQGEAQEDDYEIPDVIHTDIVTGDLFEIGEHRLLCGDSTNSDDVAKVLNNKEPYLMITDPPYGVNYDPSWRETQATKGFGAKIKAIGKVSNDHTADWTQTWALSPSKVAYIWHGGKHAAVVSKNLEDCDFEIRSQIIWAKPSLTFSRGDYHWQHEPCWYAVKRGNKGNWAGDRKQTTLWEIAGINPAGRSQNTDDVVVGHGTQKPVECMARPLKNHDGDVYDPFLGSGTTMVAAHQLNRKCYGLEIDPKYCQIIVDRMLKLDPTIEIKRNGVKYTKTEN